MEGKQNVPAGKIVKHILVASWKLLFSLCISYSVLLKVSMAIKVVIVISQLT